MLVRMLLRRYVAIAVVVSVFVAVPAIAAPAPPPAEIWLEQSTLRAAGPVTYGDTVSFGWTLDAGNKDYYVTIRVACYQDGAQVYWWAGSPDFAFPLRDQTQNGSWWDGADADCTASLMTAQNSRHVLKAAETDFHVVGVGG